IEYQKSGTCRNSALGNKDDKRVRDYYDDKFAKHSNGNKNIGYIIRSLDKTTKPEEKPLKEKNELQSQINKHVCS
ncbi:38508_t:CDS:2, partial [Gigaspora margarita]